jgi:hypothetical protein
LTDAQQGDETGHEKAGVVEGDSVGGGVEDEVVVAQVLDPTEAAGAIGGGEGGGVEVAFPAEAEGDELVVIEAGWGVHALAGEEDFEGEVRDLLSEGEEALFLLRVKVGQVGEGCADKIGLGPVELGDEVGGEVHEAVGGLDGGGSV